MLFTTYHLCSLSISACCLLYSASWVGEAFLGLGIPQRMQKLLYFADVALYSWPHAGQ